MPVDDVAPAARAFVVRIQIDFVVTVRTVAAHRIGKSRSAEAANDGFNLDFFGTLRTFLRFAIHSRLLF
jgi:hypothetical protein